MELEYMDNTKNDHYYLVKNKTDLAFIVAHMKDVDAQELNDNEILLDSMLFRMIQISDNVKKLSTEYRENENKLPWNELIGLRNRIVHDYWNDGKRTYVKYDKSALQWNKFAKEFCADDATKIFDERLKAAASLWSIVRDSDMKKEYSHELFEKYRDSITI